MRDLDSIDAEPRLFSSSALAYSRAGRRAPAPSRQVDELLDERNELTALGLWRAIHYGPGAIFRDNL